MSMRGQYFSFDAIIATVIMVLAFSSLIAYWYGAQAVVESRVYGRLADAERIAETLLSPGSPSDWEESVGDMNQIRQVGIATGFGNEISQGKLEMFQAMGEGQYYPATGNLLRSGGDYYILVERTDVPAGQAAPVAMIGKPYPDSAAYVAIATRGVTYDGHPCRMRVFLWK
jgi:hypothetical protein